MEETASLSPLLKELLKTRPQLPEVLDHTALSLVPGTKTESVGDREAIQRLFPDIYGKETITFEKSDSPPESNKPINVGVILSGGQAPGGHNVICGLFDALKARNSENRLLGFLGGPSGIIEGRYRDLTGDLIDEYRNTGGFDIIGSGRTKLESESQFEKVAVVCRKLNIGAVVIIGGDDSNTNAALLAQHFLENRVPVQVIGVPKTIDGDLKNENIEISFGFDTAVRVYSELIGNICKDANSAKKYWHFIKLMGRSASHITLECALQTHCHYAVISEEIAHKNITLDELVRDLCDTIIERSKAGKNFGVVLVPEGLIEFIPEMNRLIQELNNILSENSEYFKSLHTFESQAQFINHHLSKEASFTFSSLPSDIQLQMLADRDDHGNVSVSKIETEKLLIELCSNQLSELKVKGHYSGKFSPQHHFLGYEGRCAAPSHFDSRYCYALGYTASHLIHCGVSGYMTCIRNTHQPVNQWIPGGIPLTRMMCMEERKGRLIPVIRKALVNLEDKPFQVYASHRKAWALNDDFRFPGPIQYFGPPEVCEQTPITLKLERD